MSYTIKKLTFLLADDAISYRQILQQIIHIQPHWSIVGQASNGAEAVQLATQHLPDVALVDVDMPLMSGIEATRLIKNVSPATRVIVFSGHPDQEFHDESLRAGADYYLLKEDLNDSTLIQLVTALYP
jgi:YesN/AraC family two-component response regulator